MIPDWIEDVATDEMYQAEIIRVLKHRHLGKGKQVTLAKLIVELYDIPEDKQTENLNRKARRAMELINEAGGLIMSDTKGSWWADNLKDGLDTVDKDKVRAMNILKNAGIAEGNLLREFSGQLGMEL